MHLTDLLSYRLILLEGKRNVRPEDAPLLTAVAEKLAWALPDAIFRTGNATGADELFAAGVARVAPHRLEFVLPYGKHRISYNRLEEARYVGLDELNLAEEPALLELSLEVGQHNRSRIARLFAGEKGRDTFSAAYLVRDSLKVTGAAGLDLAPADFAVFYDDLAAPESGGTGHTMRACRQRGVPMVDQRVWMDWL